METVALMAVTVTLPIPLAGAGGGVDLAERPARPHPAPILDGMQTMPSFVYRVPASAFFSLGNVPA